MDHSKELCCLAAPGLWLEFCQLTKRKMYYSDVWTVADCQLVVKLYRSRSPYARRERKYPSITPLHFRAGSHTPRGGSVT